MSFLSDPPLHDFPDRAFRRLLEHRNNLRDLIRQKAPDLADRFDFERTELLPRSFLLDDWRGRESDLLFRIPFRTDDGEESVLVCVLLEHQSRPDPRMPLRMLIYAVLFWERQWKEWEDGHAAGQPLRLTPILPVVFHTGQSSWNSSRTLADLMDCPAAMQRFVPTWPILFWDLADETPQELLSSAGEFVKALAVVRADEADRDTYRTIYADALRRLESLSDRDKMRWSDLVHFLVSWGHQRRPDNETDQLRDAALASQAEVAHRKEIEIMSQAVQKTWAQARFDEGVVKARREDLRLLLEDRFGAIPPAVAQQIDSATDPTLLLQAIRSTAKLDSLDELRL